MDTSACALCKQNGIPIIVFDFKAQGSLRRYNSSERPLSYIAKLHEVFIMIPVYS